MKRLFLPLILISILYTPLQGQPEAPLFEVWDIRFEGNKELTSEQLENVLMMIETPKGFWRVISNISEKVGGEKQYFDPSLLNIDYTRLRNYLIDNGFFFGTVDSSLSFDVGNREVSIIYRINEGKRSFLDTLRILGLDGLPLDAAEGLMEDRLVKVGDPFIRSNVIAERTRILQYLVNSGFVNVTVDTLIAQRFNSTNNVSLTLAFTPGKRYSVGEIRIEQDGSIGGEVDPKIIFDHIELKTGDYYSEEKRLESERQLNRLGIFEITKITHVLRSPEDASTILPLNIYTRTRHLQELSPSLGIDDKNNTFNVTLGLGYNHRNFLGGARNLLLKTELGVSEIQRLNWGRFFSGATINDTTSLGRLEISAQLIQPYFFTNKIVLTTSVATLLDKQLYYYLFIARTRAGLGARLSKEWLSSVEWNLEYVEPTFLVSELQTSIISNLTDERRPQFNSILTLTVQQDRRDDLFDPSQGFLRSFVLEESGSLPSTFGSLFGTKLPYSQFWKATLSHSWYWNPGSNRVLIWAMHLRGGIAQLYGKSPANIPLNRRFFGGGSSSIRGWRARTLGELAASGDGGNAMIESGVEARLSLFRGMDDLWIIPVGKLSFAVFIDAGNVWQDVSLIQLHRIAIATGFGIRYETVAGPIRVDFGMKMFDPSAKEGHRWITERRFFAETFRDFVLHIGIGYPF